MNVHNSSAVVVDECLGEDAHETSEYDQAGGVAIDEFGERAIEFCALFVVLVVDSRGRNTGGLGSIESGCVVSIADHGYYVRWKLILAGINQCLQIAASTGDQDNDTESFRLVRHPVRLRLERVGRHLPRWCR